MEKEEDGPPHLRVLWSKVKGHCTALWSLGSKKSLWYSQRMMKGPNRECCFVPRHIFSPTGSFCNTSPLWPTLLCMRTNNQIRNYAFLWLFGQELSLLVLLAKFPRTTHNYSTIRQGENSAFAHTDRNVYGLAQHVHTTPLRWWWVCWRYMYALRSRMARMEQSLSSGKQLTWQQ